jgi:hypothetical protein
MVIRYDVVDLKASGTLLPPVRWQRTMSIADCATLDVKRLPSASLPSRLVTARYSQVKSLRAQADFAMK